MCVCVCVCLGVCVCVCVVMLLYKKVTKLTTYSEDMSGKITNISV